MSRELWKLQRSMRRILGRPALRICVAGELGLSLGQSGLWGLHRSGLIVVADEVVDEPVLLNSVVCHEAGHAASSSELEPELEPDLSGLQVLLSNPWKEWPLHRGSPWAGHDSQWVRAVLHIMHRAKAWGLVTVPEAIADLSGQYGLSSLSEYTAALGNEPNRLDWVPIDEVLARPLPAEFEELWAADVRRSGFVGSIDKGKSDDHVTGGTSTKSGAGSKRSRRSGVGVAGRRGR
jgi:hypothetical protein